MTHGHAVMDQAHSTAQQTNRRGADAERGREIRPESSSQATHRSRIASAVACVSNSTPRR